MYKRKSDNNLYSGPNKKIKIEDNISYISEKTKVTLEVATKLYDYFDGNIDKIISEIN